VVSGCPVSEETVLDTPAGCDDDPPPSFALADNDNMVLRAAHNLLMWCVVSTTAHLPFPVLEIDGLDGGTCAWECLSGAVSACIPAPVGRTFDLDFILLGCDAPDDWDDGPVDNDPERGDCCFGLTPAYWWSRSDNSPLDGAPGPVNGRDAAFAWMEFSRRVDESQPWSGPRFFLTTNTLFGPRTNVVMRC